MSFRVQGLSDRPEKGLKGHKYRGANGVHVLAYSYPGNGESCIATLAEELLVESTSCSSWLVRLLD